MGSIRRAAIGGMAAVACALAFSASASARVTPTNAAGVAPGTPQHIFYIMMENHGYDEIVGNTADAPYTNFLARHAGLATDYFGVTHPSLPNYLAAISGSYQGIWDDCKAGADVFCQPEEFVPGSGDGTDGNYLTPAEITSASNTPTCSTGRTSSISSRRTG